MIGAAVGLWHVFEGQLPVEYLITLPTSDILWLPPFSIILMQLYQTARLQNDVD